jgi:hypothetical protein
MNVMAKKRTRLKKGRIQVEEEEKINYQTPGGPLLVKEKKKIFSYVFKRREPSSILLNKKYIHKGRVFFRLVIERQNLF